MENHEALKQELIRSNPDFQALHREHQELEHQLEALYQKSLLSQEDEVEVKRIKHDKLRLKDRMFEIIRAHDDARVSA